MRYLLTLLLLCGAGLANAQALQKTVGIGDTDVSVTIRIVDSTDGTPETGVTSATGGLDLEYRREGAASVDLTESNLSALTDGHSDGGMLHIGNGYYRVDVPDAAFATGADSVLIHGTATGMVVIGSTVQITATLAVDGDGYASANVLEVNGTAQTAGDLASLVATVDTVADGIKTKTDYLPSATAGASGGLLIAGTNAATTFTSASGSGLTISSTGGNGHGLSISGNGTGEGISVTGGATGNAFELIGGSTSGQGLRVTTTSGDGIYVAAQGGTSDAMNLIGATLGNGVTIEGYIGLDISGNGAGGIQLSGATYGLDINDGFDVAGGMTVANSGGTALTLTSSGSNGHGLLSQGNGTGEGFSLVGGATGNGLQAIGGSTSGSGIYGATQGTGHGMHLIVGGGANGNGLYAVGSGSGHGMHLTAGASGEDAYLTNATNTSVGDTLDGIFTDTAEIGAAGAGLTGVPWNASWDAEVQSEAADALTAYDPPTKAELDTGLSALDSGSFYSTTVASVTSTTQYVLTDTPPADADLLNQMAVFYDTNGDPSPRLVEAYASSSGTITVSSAPGFTVATSDTVKFYPVSEYIDTALSAIDAQTNVGPVNFLPVSDYYTTTINRRGGISDPTAKEIKAGETVVVQFDFSDILNRRTLTSMAAPTDDNASVTIGDYGINGLGDGGKAVNVVLDCSAATADETFEIEVTVSAGSLSYRASQRYTVVE